MINGGIHPDVVTFNSLIDALCKEKRTEEAITMLELLSQRGVKLYGVTYNIMIRLAYKMLINGYAKSKSKEILRLADEMLQKGLLEQRATHSKFNKKLARQGSRLAAETKEKNKANFKAKLK
ncbi:hypothetical protein Gotri_004175 [Gossypium trilobum]|uniref:Pentatricopeptide repeat-containing protein n=1 Tax=Gossypium trilobum TaxID=34281 RepID=A0A7J9F4C4_9ROSI|nr:hypothetical protein [Gossypium trilobum]